MRLPLIALLGLLALTGCDDNGDSQPEESDKPALTTAPQSLPAHREHSLVKQDPHCEGDACTRVDLHWLTFDNQPALNRAITGKLLAMLETEPQENSTSLQALAEQFLDDASALPGPDHGWNLTADVRLQTYWDAILTLALETYEFTGGAHGIPVIHHLHWDLSKSRPVGLNDLLVQGQQDAFWKVAAQAHQQWLREQKLDQNFRESWPFGKTDNFFPTKDGLVLQYNVYSIAPYAMGQPRLLIEWSQLDGIVQDYYREAAQQGRSLL